MLDRLRNEIIDIAALYAPLDRGALRNHLVSRDLADIAQRLEGGTALKSERFLRPDATREEAELGFLHVLGRHRRAALETELKAAERALAEDMNEANEARLQKILMELERPDADGLENGAPGRAEGS